MAHSPLFTDDFKTEPYWWEAARPDHEEERDLPARCDVLVIGGGYAGLSAALELKRGGVDVCLIDAEALGWGASSRNGGHLSGGVNVAKSGALPPQLVHAMLEESAASYAHLEGVIRREKIDCHYVRSGRFVGAHCPSAYEAMAGRVEVLNRYADSGARMLPRARQREEVATDYYYGGMVVELSGTLHPALYHQGLLRAARAASVTLCPQTRAGKLSGGLGNFRVETNRGTIAAEQVVVATNGYTGEATPWHQRRVVPVASYIIATEEIGEERVRALFPTMRAISDSKRILYYYRPSPDHKRVIFGGRASFAARTALETAPRLHAFMCGIFPELAGVKLTHAWNGNVAFTYDRTPHMGDRDGVHFCLGCNGSGVVMMTHLGHRTALKILGKANSVSAFEQVAMPAVPLYGGNPWFLPLVGSYYQMRDWIDRKRAA